MRRLLVIAVLLLPWFIVSGQSGAVRMEFDAESETDIYHAVPCGKAGLLILHETSDMLDKNSKSWLFSFYDKDLVLKWEKTFPIIFGADFQEAEVTAKHGYLFFLNTGKVKINEESFQILSFELSDTLFHSMTGIMSSQSEFVSFDVIDNKAIASIITRRNSSEIYFINLKDATVEKTVISIADEAIIDDVILDVHNRVLDVTVSNYINRRQNTLLIFTFDLNGKTISSYQIQNVLDNKFLNTARISKPEPGIMMVAGTYNTYPGSIKETDDYSGIESAGFFIARFENDEQQYINYYNFLELQNLKTGLSSKEYYQLQKKKVRDGAEHTINYELLLHGLEHGEDGYILLSESFYPEYRTVSDIVYDYWGRPIPQTYTVFNGYKFINAIMVAFNDKGELLWDNSMELRNISTYDLDKKVQRLYDEGFTVLFYNESGKVVYEVYHHGMAIGGLEQTVLESIFPADRLMESGYSNMTHWFDNSYLCYGYQRIKNNSLTGRNRRDIFYVSRVIFE